MKGGVDCYRYGFLSQNRRQLATLPAAELNVAELSLLSELI
jgi:hypothetical protein